MWTYRIRFEIGMRAFEFRQRYELYHALDYRILKDLAQFDLFDTLEKPSDIIINRLDFTKENTFKVRINATKTGFCGAFSNPLTLPVDLKGN